MVVAEQALDHTQQVQLLFDAKARSWAAKYAPDGRLAGRLTRLADAIGYHVATGGRVLDLGCGTGELARHLAGAGLRVTGCDISANMLGQAAAAVLGAHVIGASLGEIDMAREAFRAMLKTGGAPPTGRFSDLSMLEPVKDYPPRHASTLLAFEATVEACRKALAARAPRTSRAGVA